MIADQRRAVQARSERRLAAVSHCEGCAQVCTAARSAQAAVDRACTIGAATSPRTF